MAILLGMAITVAVAWMCVAWSPVKLHLRPSEAVAAGYPEDIPGPEGIDERKAWWDIDYGPGWIQAETMGAHGAEGSFSYFRGHFTPAYRQAGWPWLALGSVVRVVSDKNGRNPTRWDLPTNEIWRRGFPTDDLPRLLHARINGPLPLLPLWPGFVADTLLYAGVVACFYPFLATATIRKKRKAEGSSA